jgi:hypothetical protein
MGAMPKFVTECQPPGRAECTESLPVCALVSRWITGNCAQAGTRR